MTEIDFEPEYEPYDTPHTPRLSYKQVQTYVGCLPTQALAKLAQGPSDDDSIDCTACWALKNLLPVHPSEPPESQGDIAFSAYVLQEWHTNLAHSEHFSRLLSSRFTAHPYNKTNYDFIQNEIKEVIGSLMYARCCAIYAAAEIELCKRKEKA